MALLRQDSTTTIQPSPGFNVGQYGMDKMMEAQGWGQLASTFQTGFDLIKQDFDRDAVQQAQQDAPALIKRDGTGMTLPVKSFEPPGLTSRAYRDAYKSLAYNLYSQSVQGDYENFLNNVQTAHPTDLDAARQAMEAKRTAIVSGLDPNYAPLITLRLNAMSGQVESKISANIQAEQNQVANTNAERAYNRVILNASQLATTPVTFDKATLATNNQLLGTQFEEADNLMKAAGWGDAKRQQYWAMGKVRTEIARDKITLSRDVAISQQDSDPQALTSAQLAWMDRIDKRAQELGPDGPAYRAEMSQAMGEFTTRNSLLIQRNQQAADNKTNGDVLALRRTLDSLGSEGGPSFTDAMNEITRRKNAVYTDPSLTTSQRVKALAAYDSLLSTGKTQQGTYVADQLTGLYTTAMNPDTPPARSKAAMQEIQNIISDPQASAYLPTGVRSYGERALAAVAMNTAKTDITTGMQFGQQGALAPADIEKLGKTWIDKGWAGDAPNSLISMPELKLWGTKARQAYLANQMTGATARQAQQTWDSGSMPTDEGRKAIEARIPAFAPSDGKPFDIANPVHQQDALARFSATSTMPQSAIDQIKGVQMGNPERAGAAATMATGMKQVMLSKGFKPDQADAWINTQIGTDIGAFLRNVQQYGHESALKLAIGAPNSVSRNAGQSVDAASADIDKAIDTVVTKNLLPGAERGVQEPLEMMARKYVPGLSLTPEQQAQASVDQRLNALLGDKAPTMGSQFWNDVKLGGKTLTGTFQSVTLDPSVRSFISTAALAVKKQHGDELKTAFKGQNPDELAVLQGLESYRGQLEFVPDPKDGTRATLTWKTANTRLGEILGAQGAPGGRLSDQDTSAYALGLYRSWQKAKREAGMPEDMIANYDPATVNMSRVTDPDGSFHWLVAAQDKTGAGSVPLMRLADDDPRLSAFAGSIANAAAHDVVMMTGKPLESRVAKAMGGSVVGKAFGWMARTGAQLFTDQSLATNVSNRLEYQGDAAPHSGKALLDWLFGSETSKRPGPAIPYDPALLVPGALPEHLADWKGMRKAVEAKMGPDFEEKARNLRLLMQLNDPNSLSFK